MLDKLKAGFDKTKGYKTLISVVSLLAAINSLPQFQELVSQFPASTVSAIALFFGILRVISDTAPFKAWKA